MAVLLMRRTFSVFSMAHGWFNLGGGIQEAIAECVSIIIFSDAASRMMPLASRAHFPHWSQAPRHALNSRMLLTSCWKTACRIWRSVTFLQMQMYIGFCTLLFIP